MNWDTNAANCADVVDPAHKAALVAAVNQLASQATVDLAGATDLVYVVSIILYSTRMMILEV